jgi:hypothetical protein
MNKFEEKELVILKPKYDDANVKRIYVVEEVGDECLKVKVESANIINKNKYKESELYVGKQYEDVPVDFFESFM